MWSKTIVNLINALKKNSIKGKKSKDILKYSLICTIISERTLLYSVLGKLIKSHPEYLEDEEYSNFIFRYLINDLSTQVGY